MEMFKCLLLSVFLAPGCPWVLKSTHSNVIPNLTDDVTLRCFCKNPYDAKPAIEQITRIRLLKMDDTVSWSTYAEVVVPDNSRVELAEPNLPGVQASGQLGELNQSFLSVTWSTASDATPGTYKCEVDGFAVHQGTNTQINTATVNITNNEVTVRDLLDVAVQMKKKSNSMSEDLKTLKEVILVQHQELTNDIMSRVQSNVEDNYFELRYWPTDSYTLLSPADGCPDTPYSEMPNGYIKIETESSKTQNHNLSSPNHLHPDVLENCGSRNVLHFRYCRNPVAKGRYVPWPKGTYCIARYGDCPKDFTNGYLELYLTSSPALRPTEKDIGNTYNWDINKNALYLHFCCRNDGDAEVPILLPNLRPFYLFRHKGKCQRVINTNVSEEWIFFDTDDAKTDKYHNAVNPDSELNDALIHLCYYQYS